MTTERKTKKRNRPGRWRMVLLLLALPLLHACGGGHTDVYRDANMDFGAVKTVAVLPFTNLSKDPQGADRVRDVFITALLASGSVYVLPPGEVARGIATIGMANPASPSVEEVVKLCKSLKADAVISAVLREYGETRLGQATGDLISMGMQMNEGQTGRIIWSASSTKGGINMKDRLLGGGGQPTNDITEKAVSEIIAKLFE